MTKEKTTEPKEEKIKCGIVMPISKHLDYPERHWDDVLQILEEAVKTTDFEPALVSQDADVVGLIHTRIVSNLYSNEMVICDVSSKNPNVMFELGLRLAFDKPTIIIKDDKTDYSFDTGVIEHLQYPSSLRFSQMVDFKKMLVDKINATYNKSMEDNAYSPFLKHFNRQFAPAKNVGQELTKEDYILQRLDEIQLHEMKFVRTNNGRYRTESSVIDSSTVNEYINIKGMFNKYIELRKIPIGSKEDLENTLAKFSLELNKSISPKVVRMLLKDFDNNQAFYITTNMQS